MEYYYRLLRDCEHDLISTEIICLKKYIKTRREPTELIFPFRVGKFFTVTNYFFSDFLQSTLEKLLCYRKKKIKGRRESPTELTFSFHV